MNSPKTLITRLTLAAEAQLIKGDAAAADAILAQGLHEFLTAFLKSVISPSGTSTPQFSVMDRAPTKSPSPSWPDWATWTNAMAARV